VAGTVRILVDVHEQRSGIPGLLEQLGAEVELLLLPAGDYALGDDTLVERKELHGDEVVELLDSVGLEKPEIDFLDDAVWPKL